MYTDKLLEISMYLYDSNFIKCIAFITDHYIREIAAHPNLQVIRENNGYVFHPVIRTIIKEIIKTHNMKSGYLNLHADGTVHIVQGDMKVIKFKLEF